MWNKKWKSVRCDNKRRKWCNCNKFLRINWKIRTENSIKIYKETILMNSNERLDFVFYNFIHSVQQLPQPTSFNATFLPIKNPFFDKLPRFIQNSIQTKIRPIFCPSTNWEQQRPVFHVNSRLTQCFYTEMKTKTNKKCNI